MNKSLLVKFAIFAAGLGIGFFGGKMLYKEYYAQIAEEDIQSVKDTFEKHRFSPDEQKYVENDAKITQQMSEAFRQAPNPLSRSSLDFNPYEQSKKAYDLIARSEGKKIIDDPRPMASAEDTDEDAEEDEDQEPEEPTEDPHDEIDPSIDRTKPYVVTSDEFNEEFNNHEKIALYYYRLDDVLTEENEEVVTHVGGTVGFEAIEKLATDSPVWVRNEKLAVDYEIMALNESYAVAVGGVNMDRPKSPREQYAQNQKKKQKRERDEE